MDTEYTEDEIKAMSMKEYRKKLPSGWMQVTRYESLVLIIDALLSSPPSREFTTGELADKAGLTEKSVNDHIGALINLGVIEKLAEDRQEVRYSLNERSPITQEIFRLNRIVADVDAGELPKSYTEEKHTRSVDNNNNLFDVKRGASGGINRLSVQQYS